ncbi:uncharacterized protein LOC124267602 [Haliotis rubra]|uniref:uncharacterized protein LOC124267602 n=1 Tax=Haliotis rubra TaxID=36100 RepID=UPI001EE5564F|nr:uncharacterized protein LOC124267602 [Haliotis rubra]
MATEDISNQQQGDDNWYSKHKLWIKANIKQRECRIFESEAYGEDCVCGKSKEDHVQFHENRRWKKEVNTHTAATEAFGTTEIGDDEDEERHEIQFVRIDEDTPFKHIKHLLFEVWNINEPKWILPLIGSRTDDSEGISEYILEAKAKADFEDRITSIGCSSWTEGLMEEKQGNKTGCFEYKTDREIFSIGKTMSHLMLVDNGTVDTYLCTLSNSSFLTKVIAGLSVPEDASPAIPAVAILFRGDLYTLETIRNYLRENIPVVIVKDSGCVANAFCYAMETSKGVSQRMKDDRNERFGTVISQRAKEQLSKMLSEMPDSGEENDEYVQVILQCLQRRIMSAIIRTKTSTDLISMVDEYLPTPVYSRKTKEKAEKHIENKRDDNYKDFEDAENIVKMVFREAILQEKSECVEFLLDCGVSAVEDLDMLELYQKTNKGLQKTVSAIFHKSKEEYENLKRIMEFISEDKEDTPNRCTFVKELCKMECNDLLKQLLVEGDKREELVGDDKREKLVVLAVGSKAKQYFGGYYTPDKIQRLHADEVDKLWRMNKAESIPMTGIKSLITDILKEELNDLGRFQFRFTLRVAWAKGGVRGTSPITGGGEVTTQPELDKYLNTSLRIVQDYLERFPQGSERVECRLKTVYLSIADYDAKVDLLMPALHLCSPYDLPQL